MAGWPAEIDQAKVQFRQGTQEKVGDETMGDEILKLYVEIPTSAHNSQHQEQIAHSVARRIFVQVSEDATTYILRDEATDIAPFAGDANHYYLTGEDCGFHLTMVDGSVTQLPKGGPEQGDPDHPRQV